MGEASLDCSGGKPIYEHLKIANTRTVADQLEKYILVEHQLIELKLVLNAATIKQILCEIFSNGMQVPVSPPSILSL